MRCIWRLVLGAGVCAGAARAQTTGARVGLGVPFSTTAIVDLDDNVFLPIGFGNLAVPIVFGNVRVEPEVGLLRISSTYSSSGSTSTFASTSLRLGLAVHRFLHRSGGFQAYAGPRVGVVRLRERSKYTGSPEQKSHTNHWYAGAALGGEYAVSPHFSLGAEAHALYIHLGQEESDGSPPPSGSPEISSSLITTNGLILVRFYP